MPVEAAPDPLLGRTLDGGYAVQARIGAGGMGVVYRARQLAVDRDVAVKVLVTGRGDAAERVRRFEREARAISRLRHPNTLRLLDFRADGEWLYLVTELLRGRSLASAIAEGPLPLERVVAIASQICGALGEAHAEGVVHRDLKPENIFLEPVDGEEVARLLDFGVALLRDDERITTDQAPGTPRYMAPEQAGTSPVDHRADLYALGVVLYEMIAGQPPFGGHTPIAVLFHHVHSRPPRFTELEPPVAVPAGLEALVRALLEKDPARRPADAAAVRAALRDDVLAAAPARRGVAGRWIGFALAVAAAGAVWWLLGRGSPVSPAPAERPAAAGVIDATPPPPLDARPPLALDAAAPPPVDAARPPVRPRPARPKRGRDPYAIDPVYPGDR